MIGLIVEGKSDVRKINMVLHKKVYFVVLNGINFKDMQIEQIRTAIKLCKKVYILTDPDDAGNKVAKQISQVFPQLNRISINPDKARVLKKRGYKFGVEYCSNKYLIKTFSEHFDLQLMV